MKKLTPTPLRSTCAALSLVSCLLANHARATVTYWDPEGTFTPTPPSVAYTGQPSSTNPPSPGTLSGIWESNLWSAASGGSATPVAWIDSTTVNYAACFFVGAGST